MKSRLSSTIWTLVLANGIVLAAVIGLAFSAGRQSGGASILDFGALPSGATGAVLVAVVLALAMGLLLAWRLAEELRGPVRSWRSFPSGWRWAIRVRARRFPPPMNSATSRTT